MNAILLARRIAAALLLMVCCGAAAQAAITTPVSIGSNEDNSASGETLQVTTTQDVPAGGSILVSSTNKDNSINPTAVTCSDSAGNGYTTDVSANAGTFTGLCSTHNIGVRLNAGSTITVTWSGASAPIRKRAQAFSVTGLAASPLDRTVGVNSGASTAASATLGAATSQANELLFAVLSDDSRDAGTAGFTPGSNGTANNCATSGTASYTSLGGVGTFPPSLFAMQCIVSATATYAANATFAANGNHAVLLATYKGGATVPALSQTSLAGLCALLLIAGLLCTGRRRGRGRVH